ncbi:MAG TPA: type IV pilus secretin PilQ [Thermoanaerobaculia bacterium]|nr:type IV pilus secretin PilQ [Thermoanaerobaculia bacterium]HUM30468.1 type IV pilus secretin PilQ [Thermoanaerobaculia bacterium]HXK68665.1 type IV pilus secretin PilQ [Thermoanaerobaculia bacterium]
MRKPTLFTIIAILAFSLAAWASAIELQTITTRETSKGFDLVIQASDTLIYTSYQKDPAHFVVELPDVHVGTALGDTVRVNGLSEPITIESRSSSTVLEIPIPVGTDYQVRSEKSNLVIAFDSPTRSILTDLTLSWADEPVLKIRGQHLPEPEIEYLQNPSRIVMDFPGTVNACPHPSYFINQDEVQRIRIAQFKMDPEPITRVVIETDRSYPVDLDTDGDLMLASLRTHGESVPVEAAPLPIPVPEPQGYSSDIYQTQDIPAEEVVYAGEPITLRLKDADIRDVITTFSEYLGINIVMDPEVSGRVTVNLIDVPWDQALDLILKINGLSSVLENNVLRIAKAAKLAQEAQEKRRIREEQELNKPLQMVLKRLSYATAQEIQGNLNPLLSKRGTINVDDRTNMLIIRDLEEYIPPVLKLIEKLDISTPQVVIEARIVETTKNFVQRLGIDWGFQAIADPYYGNTTGIRFPNTYDIAGSVALPSGNPLLSMTFGNILGSFNLDVALTAAESDGLVKIVSAPRIMTQDNLAAMIQSGVQIPVQTTANNTTTVQYIDATLRLNVTPQITAEGTIVMKIDVQKREPLTGLTVTGGQNAPLSTRQANTQVMVRDGGTTVLGGIYQITDNISKNRVPFLHRIPILGNLFKNHANEKRHDELLIFISPRIVKNL